jgi:hypothetical protein
MVRRKGPGEGFRKTFGDAGSLDRHELLLISCLTCGVRPGTCALPGAWVTPVFVGAAEGIRTPDPRITNALLYQLSYRGGDRDVARFG